MNPPQHPPTPKPTTYRPPSSRENGGLGPLHPREVALLRKLRHWYPYGEVTVLVQDGLPKKITRVHDSQLL